MRSHGFACGSRNNVRKRPPAISKASRAGSVFRRIHPGREVSIAAADFSLPTGETYLCLNRIAKPKEYLSKEDAKDHPGTCSSSYVLLKSRLRQLCSQDRQSQRCSGFAWDFSVSHGFSSGRSYCKVTTRKGSWSSVPSILEELRPQPDVLGVRRRGIRLHSFDKEAPDLLQPCPQNGSRATPVLATGKNSFVLTGAQRKGFGRGHCPSSAHPVGGFPAPFKPR